jgi:hypothetical protein
MPPFMAGGPLLGSVGQHARKQLARKQRPGHGEFLRLL